MGVEWVFVFKSVGGGRSRRGSLFGSSSATEFFLVVIQVILSSPCG